jgi:ribosomal protein L33
MKDCNHNWSNSFSINELGTLDSVLECENCGKREYQTNRQRPKHLRHISNEKYESLKNMFKQPL